MNKAKAELNMLLMNAEAESVSSSDLYIWLRESGLPSEVAIRLQSLVETVKTIGGKIVQIGKIILIKIIEFVKEHPNLVTGIAVGAAIGALVSMIPYLGKILGPIAAIIGITIGSVAGHRCDKSLNGEMFDTSVNIISISQDVIEIAKIFFSLLIDVFNTIMGKQVLQEVGV